MNRRTFLQSAAITPFALPAARGATLKGKIRKAVKFHMVNEKLSVVDKFRLLKDIGFDGVEVRTNSNTPISDFLRAHNQARLPIHGVIHAADPGLMKAIDVARELGGSSVLIVAGEDSKRTYNENFQNWLNLIRAAAPYAEKHGVKLLVENVRATFLKTAEEMARFLDACQSPAIGAYFDTGNTITWTKQNAEHWARVLGRRIVKLDIKDRGHAEFGDRKLASKTATGTNGGEVHWKNVRRELTAVEFSGWATAEVRGGDRKRLAGIARWMDQVLGLV